MKPTAFLILVLLFLGGCANPASNSGSLQRPPEVLNEAEKTSECVVMWAENRLIQKIAVELDWVEQGRITKNRLVRFKLTPGTHRLKIRYVGVLGAGMPSAKLEIVCRPNTKHFVLYTHDYEWRGAVPIGNAVMVTGSHRSRFEELDPEKAREIIAYAGIH